MSSSISKATLKAFYHVTLFAHKAVLATEEVSALQEKNYVFCRTQCTEKVKVFVFILQVYSNEGLVKN